MVFLEHLQTDLSPVARSDLTPLEICFHQNQQWQRAKHCLLARSRMAENSHYYVFFISSCYRQTHNDWSVCSGVLVLTLEVVVREAEEKTISGRALGVFFLCGNYKLTIHTLVFVITR